VAEAVARKKNGRATVPVALVEFTAAAHEHVEGGFDVTVTAGASAQPLGPYEVPAYGYLRHLMLHVVASGGVAGTLAADGPWSLFDEIALLDVNGAPIFGPLTGYQAFLANLYGGYAFAPDPRLDPDYSESVTAYAFFLRIPVEINHNNGLGSLANQNAAAPYRVRLTVAPTSRIHSVAPSTQPSVRIRGWLEAWSMPAPYDLAQRPQAQAPPRHGTTQYWSVETKAIAAGQQSPRLSRVGNLIRTLVFVARTAAGARDTTVFPTDPTLVWDARELITEPRTMRRKYMAERTVHRTTGTPAVADVPAGVLAYPFSHDVLGHAGDGTAELWLPTVQASRMEYRGSYGAAGELQILTNDVAPVEVTPQERYYEFSETGFTPEVGVPVRQ
jgi:hypothetical protein